jgi:hypothetical protein
MTLEFVVVQIVHPSSLVFEQRVCEKYRNLCKNLVRYVYNYEPAENTEIGNRTEGRTDCAACSCEARGRWSNVSATIE